jgi:hypothetical protein
VVEGTLAARCFETQFGFVCSTCDSPFSFDKFRQNGRQASHRSTFNEVAGVFTEVRFDTMKLEVVDWGVTASALSRHLLLGVLTETGTVVATDLRSFFKAASESPMIQL